MGKAGTKEELWRDDDLFFNLLSNKKKNEKNMVEIKAGIYLLETPSEFIYTLNLVI